MTNATMRIRALAPVTLLALAAAGCSADKILTTPPTTVVAAQTAVTDAVSAAAAVTGMYDALQSGSYYGTDFVILGDLASDNTQHSGTFSTYRQTDQNLLIADNSTVAGIWRAIYAGINNANNVLAKMPDASFLDAKTRNQYVGEAYFLRALGLHNATKFWGAVPIVTAPVADAAEAGNVARSDTAKVYQQILADLDAAEKNITNPKQTLQASLGAVRALRARVKLYRADWAGALAAAQSVDAMGYTLVPKYEDLFTLNGSTTAEDIFRLRFSDTDQNSESYYYYPKALGGRYEVAPTTDLRTSYSPNDLRFAWNIQQSGSRFFGAKFRSVSGTEHLHIIRYAEVVLIEAEALARLGRLPEAAAQLNKVRARAGLAPFAVNVGTPLQAVIDAIIAERRLELAFEGDRWPDMVRTGMAATFLTLKKSPLTQMLFPIPQRDRDVAPQLTQNPGY
ncbi:RagB/SusD domain-containing protein [Gemmatirosa kalamazoonensis]|uniref:RagB/SusD domain-containing protein n=1 Tax=Gemmatirosa kalamazoonensis TaxID=861299 RepID=W0RG63_9BACT|nr:RagB/SusD family nutrient uptake outer membrane protein [Gemmatirosa kalamazoonensis]AHG89761.1 RagB/SusD domain-containing protein [Gemmatirosa kalamazoonensis]